MPRNLLECKNCRTTASQNSVTNWLELKTLGYTAAREELEEVFCSAGCLRDYLIAFTLVTGKPREADRSNIQPTTRRRGLFGLARCTCDGAGTCETCTG